MEIEQPQVNSHLLPSPDAALTNTSDVQALLQRIRPAWQAKNLITRVHKLITVDPSSACQRLLNAAIHDLREKIVVAGIDIAREAAKQYRLPPIETAEDIETYSTAKVIDLAYRMGLLTRPEWRRVSRCYEIRRDLEHEDDEYEAGEEDCVYIFITCIDTILARDPIHLLKVTDVKELVEDARPVTPAESLIEDFAHAPLPRQEEICKFLISVSLNGQQSDIVQQNAYSVLVSLEPHIQNQVRLELASHIQNKVKRGQLERRHVRVALASGTLSYLRKKQVLEFFQDLLAKMNQVGSNWTGFKEHGELLRSFLEIGALRHCPAELRKDILRWLVLTYIGTPGGVTQYGHVRNVFYSNTAAPLIPAIVEEAAESIRTDLLALRNEKAIKVRLTDKHIARRFDTLLDIVDARA